MIERPVLLHENNDVLHVFERAFQWLFSCKRGDGEDEDEARGRNPHLTKWHLTAGHNWPESERKTNGMGPFTATWTVVVFVIWATSPAPYTILGAIGLGHALLWVLLVGGFDSMREILEAHTQPSLPPSALTSNGATRTMLVIGSARGLGSSCADLGARRGWIVLRADAAHSGEEFVDLTQPSTIAALCERIRLQGVRRIDAVLLVAGVCDATGVRVAGSSLPRLAWVNYLGHVVLLQELETCGIAVGRVMLVPFPSQTQPPAHPTPPHPTPPHPTPPHPTPQPHARARTHRVHTQPLQFGFASSR